MKKMTLSSLAGEAGKEGFCVLHSGEGGLPEEGGTIVGMGPIGKLSAPPASTPKSPLIGYMAYPNPHLKNDIPPARFYSYRKLATSKSLPVGSAPAEKSTHGKITASVTKAQYVKRIRAIRELLLAGEIYQMCYCIRFRMPFSGDPYSLFLRLAKNNPADFSAYLNCGDFQIISASPERFFKVERGIIVTQPIKGTAPKNGLRGLLASEKERAELDMITDLERNDVGKICEYGSLRLTKERAHFPMKNLWHTYSEVRGRLPKGISPKAILEPMFPGGSITGCPKRRAMRYIEELEALPRNIFTGSIGYITPSKMDFSIAIRTALVRGGVLEFWAGSGIVADSDPEKEYEECLLKAERFLSAL